LRGRPVSQPYIEATLAMLARHGVRVRHSEDTYSVAGRQGFHGSSFRVPGDASSAAYLWAAAAVAGGRVRVRALGRDWPQADLRVLDLLEKYGAQVALHRDGATVTADSRRSFTVNLTDAPDLYPLAGVLAATVPGTCRILGAEHVVHKESDRREETIRLIGSFGGRTTSTPHGVTVHGTARPRAVHLPHLSDHRLVMSAAIGALAASGPSIIGERDAVRKSFPQFWDRLSEITSGGSGP